jgi:hypothetical protein
MKKIINLKSTHDSIHSDLDFINNKCVFKFFLFISYKSINTL